MEFVWDEMFEQIFQPFLLIICICKERMEFHTSYCELGFRVYACIEKIDLKRSKALKLFPKSKGAKRSLEKKNRLKKKKHQKTPKWEEDNL